MIYNIKKCFEQNWVASFYCDIQTPESHLTGLIGAYDEDFLIVKHISPDGLYDGFILVRTNDVFRIDLNGLYEDKVRKLYECKNQSHPDCFFEDDLCSSLLDYSQRCNKMVSVEIGNDTITGLVHGYNSEYIYLTVFDKFGRNNGETVIACDKVISIAVDTSIESNIHLLVTTSLP